MSAFVSAERADRRYANKLISGKGLALSVYDILTAENGKATWGNGLMYYKGVSFGKRSMKAHTSLVQTPALRAVRWRGASWASLEYDTRLYPR